MRVKLIVIAVRSACHIIGMQYRDRVAVEAFQKASTEVRSA